MIVEDPKIPGTKALPVDTIAAITRAAHDADRIVIAHAVTSRAVQMADDAGVDVITHTPLDADLTGDRMAMLSSRRVVLIPTLTMMHGVVAVVTSRRCSWRLVSPPCRLFAPLPRHRPRSSG